MKAIILAGGRGTRLKEVIKDIPKPMALIAERPFLEYLILKLIKCGVKEIILSVGYKKEKIKSYFGNGSRLGVKINYCEEKRPLGTGGALKKALALTNDELMLVLNGDSFFDFDLKRLLSCYIRNKAIAIIGLTRVNDSTRYGSVQADKQGKVVCFFEKGKKGRGVINAGVYVFNRAVINSIPDGKVSLEKDVLEKLVGCGLYGMVAQGFFIDIGLPQDYLSLAKNPGRLLNAVSK